MLVAALFLAACSGGGGDDDLLELQATEEPAASIEDPDPSPSPEAEPEDPYAVPDEIDEAYVERVINAILEVQTEVLRGALQHEVGQNLDADLMALHFATTDGAERMAGLEELQEYIDFPESRGGLFEPADFGGSHYEVDYLHHTESDRCILVLGFWDRTEISSDAPDRSETLTAFSLGRVDEAEARSAGNPTPWVWRDHRAVDAALPATSYPELPWADELDHSCEELDGGEPR
jgi:hypothetical protein